MLETIRVVNSAINAFVWGIPAMFCMISVGLVLSIKTRFVQFRRFGYAMKSSIGCVFKKQDHKEMAITPFQAVCTALAATIGTGSVAGVAGAIAIGGPGAVFWMWISALLGMCTKFSEVVLAVRYREKNQVGEYVGGPMYYIKNGLDKRWHWMATLYACLTILAVFGTGNTTQVNTIVTAIDVILMSNGVVVASQLGMINLLLGNVIAVLIGVILIGGVKRIGNVTEKLVPMMSIIYILLSLGVVIVNIEYVPAVVQSIVSGAFRPSAVTGGVVGSLFLTMRKGISRGIFSNEAGIGTGSIAHACADTDHPVRQGMFGIFEVFTATILVCTLTALVILCSGISVAYGKAAGAELPIAGFVSVYGSWVTVIVALAICCFAFSTIIGWGFYAVRAVEFVFSGKFVKVFMMIYAFVSVFGATLDLGFIWDISDTCNGLMCIPNLVSLFLLSGTVVKLIKEYFEEHT